MKKSKVSASFCLLDFIWGNKEFALRRYAGQRDTFLQLYSQTNRLLDFISLYPNSVVLWTSCYEKATRITINWESPAGSVLFGGASLAALRLFWASVGRVLFKLDSPSYSVRNALPVQRLCSLTRVHPRLPYFAGRAVLLMPCRSMPTAPVCHFRIPTSANGWHLA